jgi:glycosyltransferase involved in cell wall biosynthesis
MRRESIRIAILLPVREKLSKRQSGAVALSLADFVAFSRRRAETVILGSFPCDIEGVPFWQLTNWRRWHLRDRLAYTQAAADFARHEGVALMEVENRPTILTGLRKILPDAKLVLYLHNNPHDMEGTRTAAQRRRVLTDADAIYCVSNFIRSKFLEGVADEDGKVQLLYLGFDVAQVPKAAKERIIAFAGRMVREKGVLELIRAFARAGELLGDWRLVLAGEDKKGLLSGREIRSEMAALGDRLVCLGRLDHPGTLNLFARAEIAATPALWPEPLGRTNMEAMAAGCALVSSGSGGSAELLDDCGLIVDPTNAAAFAEALVLLANDGPRRRDLQARARARVAEKFDIRIAAGRLDEARDRVLERD